MSSRVSGHSGRPRMAVRAALLLTALGLVAGPVAPLATAAETNGLSVTTPFPSIVTKPGSTATFKLTIASETGGDVALSTDRRPRRLDRALHRRRPHGRRRVRRGGQVGRHRPRRRHPRRHDHRVRRDPRRRARARGHRHAAAHRQDRGGRRRRGHDDLRLPGAAWRGQHDLHVQPDAPQRDRAGADLRARRAGPRPELDRQRQARRPVAGGEHRRQARLHRVDHGDRRGAGRHRGRHLQAHRHGRRRRRDHLDRPVGRHHRQLHGRGLDPQPGAVDERQRGLADRLRDPGHQQRHGADHPGHPVGQRAHRLDRQVHPGGPGRPSTPAPSRTSPPRSRPPRTRSPATTTSS